MNDIETAYRELNDKVKKLDRRVQQVSGSMLALEIAIDEIRHQVKILGDAIFSTTEGSDG